MKLWYLFIKSHTWLFLLVPFIKKSVCHFCKFFFIRFIAIKYDFKTGLAILLFLIGKNDPECDFCGGDPDKNCHSCSCRVCGGKQEPSMQLLCDECNMAYHIYCLNPPLDKVPEEEYWYDFPGFCCYCVKNWMWNRYLNHWKKISEDT